MVWLTTVARTIPRTPQPDQLRRRKGLEASRIRLRHDVDIGKNPSTFCSFVAGRAPQYYAASGVWCYSLSWPKHRILATRKNFGKVILTL
jgi:hypothetical protein